MMMIADSGSTKTNWCFINDLGKKICFETEGYNPYFINTEYISNSLRDNIPDTIRGEKIDELFFYGAGCASGRDDIIEQALQKIFPGVRISIEMDMLGAARGLLGYKPGFAAILGTGTNTCIYDGNKIVKNIDSLGFILGDEGSGGAIGKKLLSEYMRNNMPSDVHDLFWSEYHLSPDEIMHQIYTKPMANRFCAAFCTFINDHIDNSYLQSLVKICFRDFFEKLVSKYENYQHLTFNSIGSIGLHFKSILISASHEFDMKIGQIMSSPMEGLVDYHIQADLKKEL